MQTVEAGSPAAKAGIRGGDISADIDGEPVQLGGDVIQEIDGKTVTNAEALTTIIGAKKTGDKVKVRYLRDGRKKTAEIKLGARPTSLGRSQQQQHP